MHERVQGINQYLKLPSIGVCMTMAEPLEPRCQKTEDGVSLNSVPALASQRIWSAVRKKMDRRYIMAVSKGVQATFASAVDYLRYHLQDDDANPSSPRGLHPAVQPKKLEIAERIQQGKHAGLSSLHALASSPHWRRLECLYLDKITLDEDTARSLEPLFQLGTITKLKLRDCSIHPASLPYLAACKQLQSLHLRGVTLEPGAEAAFSALAGLSSLTLIIGNGNAPSNPPAPHAAQLFDLLRSVGKSLTCLKLLCSSSSNQAGEMEQLLKVVNEGHLSCLTHLEVQAGGPKKVALSVPREQLNGLPESCPLLRELKLDLVLLPDPQLLAALMSMAALEHLEVLGVKEPRGTPGTPLRVTWPAGKAPMSVKFYNLSVTFLQTLPLQHISKLRCDCLHMEASAESTVAGECNKVKQLQDFLRRRGASLETYRLIGRVKEGDLPVSGLSALSGPDSPLVLQSPRECCLYNMALSDSDIQAVAKTWGSGLQVLKLRCSLTPPAWAAITAASFPALDTLKLQVHAGAQPDAFAVHLAALCLDWPTGRTLKVAVQGQGEQANQVAAACRATLAAHRRRHVKVKFESD